MAENKKRFTVSLDVDIEKIKEEVKAVHTDFDNLQKQSSATAARVKEIADQFLNALQTADVHVGDGPESAFTQK